MEFYEGIEQCAEVLRKSPSVVTIGNFDGVHLGHQAILRQVSTVAERLGAAGIALTFWPHPREALNPEKSRPWALTTWEEKRQILEAQPYGLKVIKQPFDLEFSSIEAENFVEDLLIGRLGAVALVAGHDLAFGKNRRGTVEFLKSRQRGFNLEIEEIEPLTLGGKIVSSTAIRDIISDGKMEEARRFLGRRHRLRGLVVQGDGRGATIGFPTANLKTEPEKLLPPDGVYAVKASVDGADLDGVMNIGTRPTFGLAERTVEVYLIDFKGDLYGRHLTVEMAARLRPEKKFEGKDALIEQIRRDIQKAKALLSKEVKASHAS